MAMNLDKATFRGYPRANGRVGVRNHVAMLPVDDISNAAPEGVARNIGGTMAIPHPHPDRRQREPERRRGGGDRRRGMHCL